MKQFKPNMIIVAVTRSQKVMIQTQPYNDSWLDVACLE